MTKSPKSALRPRECMIIVVVDGASTGMNFLMTPPPDMPRKALEDPGFPLGFSGQILNRIEKDVLNCRPGTHLRTSAPRDEAEEVLDEAARIVRRRRSPLEARAPEKAPARSKKAARSRR